MKRSTYGFTVVELLIVIVVIAVLAAISIVAYTGIQQQARNTATVQAASSSLKLLQAYIAQEEAYPLSHPSGEILTCITDESGCRGTAGNTITARESFSEQMERVGSLPKSTPFTTGVGEGVLYFYRANAINTGDGLQSAWLVYWLQGEGQDCGLPNVLTESYPYQITSGGNSHSAQGGKTRCNILVPGPAHS